MKSTLREVDTTCCRVFASLNDSIIVNILIVARAISIRQYGPFIHGTSEHGRRGGNENEVRCLFLPLFSWSCVTLAVVAANHFSISHVFVSSGYLRMNSVGGCIITRMMQTSSAKCFHAWIVRQYTCCCNVCWVTMDSSPGEIVLLRPVGSNAGFIRTRTCCVRH